MTKGNRLQDLTPTAALRFCINLTWPYWKPLESAEVLALLAVFREYIMNGYDAAGLNVPAGRVADTWERCRVIIDNQVKEAPQA